jgi:deoxyhypusine synthase
VQVRRVGVAKTLPCCACVFLTAAPVLSKKFPSFAAFAIRSPYLPHGLVLFCHAIFHLFCSIMLASSVQRNTISRFIEDNFLHFNAAALVDAAKGYERHLAEGGKMMITLAGAMSTAELGKTLAEMIRQDKVQIISCTGANLEEDIMNLVAHTHYKRVPNYRDLSPKDEWELLEGGFNRVTDTCIPEEEAFRRIQKHIFQQWKTAQDASERFFPHEFMYKMLLSGDMKQYYEIDPKNSWMLAAAEKNLPIIVPGWEDSTMGNIFASYCIKGELQPSVMKSGIEYMMWLSNWYIENSKGKGVGFFQIGGGIAGDFPICVVPMLYQDLEMEDIPFWSYFCQISDSTTSFGSYSGAVPNEKITWGKLAIDTPKFIVESDATIVAPLIFAWLLNM